MSAPKDRSPEARPAPIRNDSASPDPSPDLRRIDVSVLETLFDRTPDTVFFVKDRHGRYVAVNGTLVERCGLRSKADVLGKTAVDLFGHALGHRYVEQDARVLEEGVEVRDRLELHLVRGRRPGWCLTYKVPLRGTDGGIVGLIGLSKDLQQPDTRDETYARLAEVVERIRTDYSEPLRIDALVHEAGLTRARFERGIKRIFGLTPGQLLAKVRLDAASQLLRDAPELNISEVAHASGYADHSAFTRHFKTVVGLTPTEFRQLPD